MTRPVLIVGAGWSGAVVANRLTEAGMNVEVFERASVVGGHSRVESLCGVTYEPNGPHILHTDNEQVATFLTRLGLGGRPYRFQPLTRIELPDGEMRYMSWPIQVNELEALPDWPRIEHELDELDSAARSGAYPRGDDFETYAVSLMGRRLYEYFIEGYTRKQWGCEPSTLSSSFAPKRIDLRRDGNKDLFRDRWQWFPAAGVNSAIEQLLAHTSLHVGCGVMCADLHGVDAAAVVVTAALDEFTGGGARLPWRGIKQRSRFVPCYPEQTRTRAYVVNQPSMSVPYTRTIESKHATGQWIHGTVVSKEYPGADARHYPVADVYGVNEATNRDLQADVRALLAPTPVFFTGRLATYRYINQDEAIAQAWECADAVMREVLS